MITRKKTKNKASKQYNSGNIKNLKNRVSK